MYWQLMLFQSWKNRLTYFPFLFKGKILLKLSKKLKKKAINKSKNTHFLKQIESIIKIDV